MAFFKLNYENELDPIINEEAETSLEDFYELIFKDKSKKELVFKNLVSNDYLLSEVTEDMLEDIENKETRSESNLSSEKEMQQNAFERLGKDVVIIETLSIMNIIFAISTISLIGALIFTNKKKS